MKKITQYICFQTEMFQNTSREVICFELRQQSRRATNTDAVLVTEEGEEVTVHQAVLGLHSRLFPVSTLQPPSPPRAAPSLPFLPSHSVHVCVSREAAATTAATYRVYVFHNRTATCAFTLK